MVQIELMTAYLCALLTYRWLISSGLAWEIGLLA